MKRASDFPKILICTEPTDMRKQSVGLSIIVESHLKEKPFGEYLFIFCNRRRDIIKALYFDKAGFCLWSKRLDQSRFPWLKKTNKKKLEISADDFDLLLDGVDVFKRHKKLNFESIL